jgi:hypothetical protein
VITELKRNWGAPGRLRLVALGMAASMGLASLTACGDESDGAATASGSASATDSSTQVSTKATTAQSAATIKGDSGSTQTKEYKALTAQGTARIGTLRFGTPGTVVIKPKGYVPGRATYHWYKVGTAVTVRAKDTRTARFVQWGGICHGTQRVCRFTVRDLGKDAVGSFVLNPKGAKGLKKSDPRLKVVIGD